jgi:hypothetical protein
LIISPKSDGTRRYPRREKSPPATRAKTVEFVRTAPALWNSRSA